MMFWGFGNEDHGCLVFFVFMFVFFLLFLLLLLLFKLLRFSVLFCGLIFFVVRFCRKVFGFVDVLFLILLRV